MTPNESDPDFDLRHFLRDTLIMLGCKQEIADLLDKSQDLSITTQDVDAVRNYNMTLLNELKGRMAATHKMTIRTKGEPT
jgi:hypothetical protein